MQEFLESISMMNSLKIQISNSTYPPTPKKKKRETKEQITVLHFNYGKIHSRKKFMIIKTIIVY